MGEAEFVQHIPVGGHADKVARFVGVCSQIVELLRRLWFAPKNRLCIVGEAFVKLAAPDQSRRCSKLSLNVLCLGAMRHKIADVHKLPVGNAAHKIRALIHAATKSIEKRLRTDLERSGKCMPLHCGRGLQARQTQQRWREINEAHEAIRLRARCVFFWCEVPPLLRKENHHRHAESGVRRPSLTARHAGPMVCEVKNDRVACEARSLQFFEFLPGSCIGDAHLIVVLRPIVSHLRRIRVIRRDSNRGRICDQGVRASGSP